jgi:hypothetical protein
MAGPWRKGGFYGLMVPILISHNPLKLPKHKGVKVEFPTKSVVVKGFN